MTAQSILLSAGHSNTDPGAVAQGRREADIAVEFRNIVSWYLTQYGVPHDTDGKGTDNYPLPVAAKMAKLHDLALEFHCNSGPATATGVEVLAASQDMGLAAKVSAAIAGALGIRNRGAKPEGSGQHHRLAFVRAGGMVVELFFLTNRGDLKAYYDRKWLAARAVANVLAGEAMA